PSGAVLSYSAPVIPRCLRVSLPNAAMRGSRFSLFQHVVARIPHERPGKTLSHHVSLNVIGADEAARNGSTIPVERHWSAADVVSSGRKSEGCGCLGTARPGATAGGVAHL